MQIVTLTTDWGTKDWFNGQIKGILYSTIPDVNVVDLSHSIQKFDTRPAAFVIKNSCLNFPKGTIHIIDINTYEEISKSFIVVKYKEQYFICTDNGLPSMVFEDEQVEITDCSNVLSDSNYYTFAVLDLFVKITRIIVEDKGTDRIGNRLEDFMTHQSFPLPIIKEDRIICQIIYIDDYGNAYLNIDYPTFEKILAGRKFTFLADVRCEINKISKSYADATMKNKILLTVSATNHLELAVRENSISQLLGYKIGKQIVIEIK